MGLEKMLGNFNGKGINETDLNKHLLEDAESMLSDSQKEKLGLKLKKKEDDF
jgi:hypothetical protein